MLFFALLFSSAAAMEISLNMTGSGTPQSSSPPTDTAVTSTLPPSTITETLASVSSISSTVSSAAASPTITGGPIYTSIACELGQGRQCDRLPEQPYYYGMVPGNSIFGFTPPGMQNPWAYFTSFLDFNLSTSAEISASSCSAAWSSSLVDWLATEPLTTTSSYPIVPAMTVTSTIAAYTATNVYQSITGTGALTETFTDVESGVTSIETTTDNSALLYATTTSTINQVATTEAMIFTSYTPYFYPSDYSWKPSPPCCSACTILAGNIEVMYWPATGLAGNQTTVVNTAGFTFTSPSIYMAVQTLAATDLCGTVGTDISTATTLSFAQNELSTAVAYSSGGTQVTDLTTVGFNTTFLPATFGTASCTDVTTTMYFEDLSQFTIPTTVVTETGITFTDTYVGYTLTYNPCFPYISIPAQVRDEDPRWATCVTSWQFALFDPPYTISSAAGLVGFSSSTASADTVTSAQPLTTSSSDPTVGQTVPTIAPVTNTKTPIPTTATSASVDPPSTPSGSAAGGDPPTQSSTIPAGAGDPTKTSSTASVVVGNPPPQSSTAAGDPTQSSSAASVVVGNPPTQSSAAAGDPTQSSSTASVAPGNPSTQSPAATGDPTQSSSTAPIVAGNPPTQSSNTAGGVGDPPTQSSSIPAGAGNPLSQTTSNSPSPPVVVTIGSSTITANSASAIVIGSQTLTAGGQVIVSGTTVSLAPSATALVIGTSTQALVSPTLFIGSQTLSAGGAAITVSGTVFSLQSGGSSVVIGGTTTQALSALIGSGTTTGIGGAIVTIGGFQMSTTGSGSQTSSTGFPAFNGTTFTGDAVGRGGGSVWMWGMALGAVVVSVACL